MTSHADKVISATHIFLAHSECLLSSFLLVNIRTDADPQQDFSRGISLRQTIERMPAIHSLFIPEPHFTHGIHPGHQSTLPGDIMRGYVLGMKHLYPCSILLLVSREAGIVIPLLVEVVRMTVRIC